MNEVTDLLETIDFPEAVTGGLRRTTDQLRSVVERTRGDVTLSLDRKKLENQLKDFKDTLKNI
jgi:translin